jgi:hypothetical protein
MFMSADAASNQAKKVQVTGRKREYKREYKRE